jgi:hypothetical protein
MTTHTQWDDEGYWNATLGPYATRATVLACCETQHVSPRDYIYMSILGAQMSGADFDRCAAYDSLLLQLGLEGLEESS